MILFTSQLLLVLTIALQIDDGAESSAEQLYQQAAEAIESGSLRDAAEPLRTLVEQHGGSSLALPSAVRLAELELISGRIAESVRLLVDWIPRTPCEASASGGIIHESNVRMAQLLANALTQLPEDQTDWLSQLVSQDSALQGSESQGAVSSSSSSNPDDLCNSKSTVDLMLTRELAKRAVRSGEYEMAIDWIDRLGKEASEHERKLRDFSLPLAVLRLNPSLENIHRAQRILAIEHERPDEGASAEEQTVNDSLGLDLSEQFSLRLAIAEAFRLIADRTSAIRELEHLAEKLAKHSEALKSSASSAQSQALPTASSTETLTDSEGISQRQLSKELATEGSYDHLQIENWRATVDLRRAELLLLEDNFRGAFTLLSTATNMYPQFPNRDEFCFLLARCLIADIEFDKAADELRMVISRNESSSESVARGLWMLGEIEFLKREYDQAILHYSQVGQIDSHPTWQARGLLQLGKCYELRSRFSEAAAVYGKIGERFANSEVAEVARDRLKVLQERVPQATAERLIKNPGVKKIR